MPLRSFPDCQRPVYDIAGLPFDAVNLSEAVRIFLRSVEYREPLFVSTPNLNFLIAAQTDQEFRSSVFQSDLCVADGMPIVWLARLLGIPLRSRVSGSDLFDALCVQSERTVKVFFFGGPDGAAQLAAERVNQKAQERQRNHQTPGVLCVGYESPGFGSIDDMSRPELIDRINASGADFVVVSVGARKGQVWIQRNRARLDAPVISYFGAVINMAAGTVARAPRWMQKTGLEWVWRIKEEPQLWRRYASDGWALLRLLVTQIAPQVVRRWRRRLFSPAAGRLEFECQDGLCRLRLHGDWSVANIAELRTRLMACGAQGNAVEIDTSDASDLDAAVRGLLAIVRGHQASGKS